MQKTGRCWSKTMWKGNLLYFYIAPLHQKNVTWMKKEMFLSKYRGNFYCSSNFFHLLRLAVPGAHNICLFQRRRISKRSTQRQQLTWYWLGMFLKLFLLCSIFSVCLFSRQVWLVDCNPESWSGNDCYIRKYTQLLTAANLMKTFGAMTDSLIVSVLYNTFVLIILWLKQAVVSLIAKKIICENCVLSWLKLLMMGMQYFSTSVVILYRLNLVVLEEKKSLNIAKVWNSLF